MKLKLIDGSERDTDLLSETEARISELQYELGELCVKHDVAMFCVHVPKDPSIPSMYSSHVGFPNPGTQIEDAPITTPEESRRRIFAIIQGMDNFIRFSTSNAFSVSRSVFNYTPKD